MKNFLIKIVNYGGIEKLKLNNNDTFSILIKIADRNNPNDIIEGLIYTIAELQNGKQFEVDGNFYRLSS